ncbi:MAG: FecR family protein [Anaerolineae bacterium]
MRSNPERVAWLVLLSAFAAFVLIAVGVPLGVRWRLVHAEAQHSAVIESLSGTVVVEPPVGSGPIPLSKGQSLTVSEGTTIRLDESSDAVVTFFDHGFMRIYSNSIIRLDTMRSRRYSLGEMPNHVVLNLQQGRIQIGTALDLEAPLSLTVVSPQGESLLDADGSYLIEVTEGRTEVTAHRGHARITDGQSAAELVAGQRTAAIVGGGIEPVTGLARNLVNNGDFDEPLDGTWRVYNDQGTDGGEVNGSAEVVEDEGGRAVRFWREGGHGDHCETILEQTIDRELPDLLSSLEVRATVKVRWQSLSGGGYLSSEYPLMIRLTYRDAYDSEAEWIQGFYYQNDAGTPTTYGQEIPEDTWYIFESGNILDQLTIRPYKLVRLRVYASGWDYDSMIGNVNLIVE